MPSHFLKTTNNLTQFFIIQNNHFGLKLAVTYQCALQLRDIIHRNLCKETRKLVNIYSVFTFLLEFMMTSSMTEKI